MKTLGTLVTVLLVFFALVCLSPAMAQYNYEIYLRPGGSLNGQPINTSNPVINVSPGENLSGTIKIQHIKVHSGDVVPLIYTPNWGNHSTSYNGVASTSQGTHNFDVSINNLQASTTPGTYLIIFASAGRYTYGQVAAVDACNCGNNLLFGDGNDIADLTKSDLPIALSEGVGEVLSRDCNTGNYGYGYAGITYVEINVISKCSTFDFSTNTVHIPCLNLESSSYWLDLGLVSEGLEIKNFGVNGPAESSSACATFNFLTNTLHIPCFIFDNINYWFDLELISSFFVIKDYGVEPTSSEFMPLAVGNTWVWWNSDNFSHSHSITNEIYVGNERCFVFDTEDICVNRSDGFYMGGEIGDIYGEFLLWWKYPCSVGDSWTYVDPEFGEEVQNRILSASTNISTDAGNFNCILLEKKHDYDGWYGYVNRLYWGVPGVGWVKHEAYDENGVFLESDELVSYTLY